jgi:hypothetical protein
VPTNSTFDKDGKLTPEEFEYACEKLVQICPTWGFKTAVSAKGIGKHLPEDHQFISTKVISLERAKSALSQIEINEVVKRGITVRRTMMAGSRRR